MTKNIGIGVYQWPTVQKSSIQQPLPHKLTVIISPMSYTAVITEDRIDKMIGLASVHVCIILPVCMYCHSFSLVLYYIPVNSPTYHTFVDFFHPFFCLNSLFVTHCHTFSDSPLFLKNLPHNFMSFATHFTLTLTDRGFVKFGSPRILGTLKSHILKNFGWQVCCIKELP